MATIRFLTLILLIPFGLTATNFLAEAPAPKPQVQVFSDVGVYEITLKNGMRVVMKPTPYDDGQVFIDVTALGGFAGLPESMQAAARVAPEFVLKSGLGVWTADELAVELFENGLELEIEITPSSRKIEGEGRVERIEILLQFIHDVFEDAKIVRSAFPTTKAELVKAIERRECNQKCQYETAFKAVNSKDYLPLRRVTSEEVQAVSYQDVDIIYHNAFRDPAQFVCVVVGDFEVDKMIPLLEESLQTIPKGVGTQQWHLTELPPFPKGVTSKTVTKENHTESLTRITFPVTTPIAERNITTVKLAAETIEARLREALRKKFRSTHGIDASIAFPLAPSLNNPWLTIQFRSDPEVTPQIIRTILQELKSLHRLGPTEQNIDDARQQLARLDHSSKHDNIFWVRALTKYSLLGWDPNGILNHKPTDKEVLETLQSFISLDNHTIITGEL